MTIVHRIQLDTIIRDLIGVFPDYIIDDKEIDCFEDKQVIEIVPNRYIELYQIVRSTECFEANYHRQQETLLSVLFSVDHLLQRISRMIASFMKENDFDTLISYPQKGTRLVNKNGIYLKINPVVDKWDFKIELSVLLAMFKA